MQQTCSRSSAAVQQEQSSYTSSSISQPAPSAARLQPQQAASADLGAEAVDFARRGALGGLELLLRLPELPREVLGRLHRRVPRAQDVRQVGVGLQQQQQQATSNKQQATSSSWVGRGAPRPRAKCAPCAPERPRRNGLAGTRLSSRAATHAAQFSRIAGCAGPGRPAAVRAANSATAGPRPGSVTTVLASRPKLNI